MILAEKKTLMKEVHVCKTFTCFGSLNYENFEPPHDKTNKMTCATSDDSDQPGHPPSLINLNCSLEESLDS